MKKFTARRVTEHLSVSGTVPIYLTVYLFGFQFGEDGIIKTAFECINTTSKYYVEFGVQDGSECHSRLLRDKGKRG